MTRPKWRSSYRGRSRPSMLVLFRKPVTIERRKGFVQSPSAAHCLSVTRSRVMVHPGTRQSKPRGCSDPKFAAQNQLAAMQLDEGLGDRQPKAGTRMLAGQVIFNLLEWLEHLFDLLWRNPASCIADQKY